MQVASKEKKKKQLGGGGKLEEQEGRHLYKLDNVLPD